MSSLWKKLRGNRASAKKALARESEQDGKLSNRSILGGALVLQTEAQLRRRIPGKDKTRLESCVLELRQRAGRNISAVLYLYLDGSVVREVTVNGCVVHASIHGCGIGILVTGKRRRQRTLFLLLKNTADKTRWLQQISACGGSIYLGFEPKDTQQSTKTAVKRINDLNLADASPQDVLYSGALSLRLLVNGSSDTASDGKATSKSSKKLKNSSAPASPAIELSFKNLQCSLLPGAMVCEAALSVSLVADDVLLEDGEEALVDDVEPNNGPGTIYPGPIVLVLDAGVVNVKHHPSDPLEFYLGTAGVKSRLALCVSSKTHRTEVNQWVMVIRESLQEGMDKKEETWYNQNRHTRAMSGSIGGMPEYLLPDEQNKDVLMMGWLKKEGGSVKSIKTRHFRLTLDSLSYYKTETDTNPLGQLSLVGCDVKEEKPKHSSNGESTKWVFSVTPAHDSSNTKARKYILFASTEQDVIEWTSKIRVQVEKWNMEKVDRHSIKEGFVRRPGEQAFSGYLVLKESTLAFFTTKPRVGWYSLPDEQYSLGFCSIGVANLDKKQNGFIIKEKSGVKNHQSLPFVCPSRRVFISWMKTINAHTVTTRQPNAFSRRSNAYIHSSTTKDDLEREWNVHQQHGTNTGKYWLVTSSEGKSQQHSPQQYQQQLQKKKNNNNSSSSSSSSTTDNIEPVAAAFDRQEYTLQVRAAEKRAAEKELHAQGMALLKAALQEKTRKTYRVIHVHPLQAYSQPDVSAAPVTTLPPGADITALEQHGPWIRYAQGWVQGSQDGDTFLREVTAKERAEQAKQRKHRQQMDHKLDTFAQADLAQLLFREKVLLALTSQEAEKLEADRLSEAGEIYLSCLLGCELVDFLVSEGICRDKLQALQTGEWLITEKGLRSLTPHVTTFEDDYVFYTFLTVQQMRKLEQENRSLSVSRLGNNSKKNSNNGGSSNNNSPQLQQGAALSPGQSLQDPPSLRSMKVDGKTGSPVIAGSAKAKSVRSCKQNLYGLPCTDSTAAHHVLFAHDYKQDTMSVTQMLLWFERLYSGPKPILSSEQMLRDALPILSGYIGLYLLSMRLITTAQWRAADWKDAETPGLAVLLGCIGSVLQDGQLFQCVANLPVEDRKAQWVTKLKRNSLRFLQLALCVLDEVASSSREDYNTSTNNAELHLLYKVCPDLIERCLKSHPANLFLVEKCLRLTHRRLLNKMVPSVTSSNLADVIGDLLPEPQLKTIESHGKRDAVLLLWASVTRTLVSDSKTNALFSSPNALVGKLLHSCHSERSHDVNRALIECCGYLWISDVQNLSQRGLTVSAKQLQFIQPHLERIQQLMPVLATLTQQEVATNPVTTTALASVTTTTTTTTPQISVFSGVCALFQIAQAQAKK